jgi:hypothetical protein
MWKGNDLWRAMHAHILLCAGELPASTASLQLAALLARLKPVAQVLDTTTRTRIANVRMHADQ